MRKRNQETLFILCIVSHNIITTEQFFFNNQFSESNIYRNGRRNDNFEYNYKDWEIDNTQTDPMDFIYDEHNAFIVSHGDRPFSVNSTSVTPEPVATSTTTAIYVTLPTEVTTVEASGAFSNTSAASEPTPIGTRTTTPAARTVTENVTDGTTVATQRDNTTAPTPDTPTTAVSDTMTAEVVMTFPKPTSMSEKTTIPASMDDYHMIHYPSNMTFPELYTTIPVSLPVIGDKMVQNVTEPTTTLSPFVVEFMSDMRTINAGYFTTFLYKSFRIFSTKNATHALALFHALEKEVTDLNTKNKFSGFGKSTIVAFMEAVQLLVTVPADVIRTQAALGSYLITNRVEVLGPDIVRLMNDADNAYVESDGKRILLAVEDVNNYPNTTKDAAEIAHEVMEAVVVAPFKRLYGTPTAQLLVQRLDKLVVNKVFSGHTIYRRMRDDSGSHEVVMTPRSRRTRTTPTPLTERTRSTAPTTAPDAYAIFSKNETIKKTFKKRMKYYKWKRHPKKWKQWRSEHTTTTTTTDEKRSMGTKKSIYVIKRYVKRKMKKRRTKLVTNYTGYYKFTDVANEQNASVTRVVSSFILLHKDNELVIKENKEDYVHPTFRETKTYKRRGAKLYLQGSTKLYKRRSSNEGSFKRMRQATRMRQSSGESSSQQVTSGNKPKRFTVLNRDGMRSKDYMRKFELLKRIREESSVTDEERILNANLDDALFHGQEPVLRNVKIEEDFADKKKRIDESSMTDEEPVLKSNIYKGFGYEKNFAEVFRRGRDNK